MNIVLYLVLWSAIGILFGVVTNWIAEMETWVWFWVDLLCGFAGAIIAGYYVVHAFFGMEVVLSAFSLLFAGAGAAFLLLLARFLHKLMR